jgi:hypothetical protein
MKKILASLFVTSVAICSASAASAQLPSTPVTSVHSGNVPSACTVTATPGTLSSASAITSSINSLSSPGIPGRFTAICNSTHKFEAKLLPGTKPLSVPTTYVEKFRLLNPSTGYEDVKTSAFSADTFTSPSLNPTSSTGYTVDVAAEASVTSPATLPSGTSGPNSYVINVQATLVP